MALDFEEELLRARHSLLQAARQRLAVARGHAVSSPIAQLDHDTLAALCSQVRGIEPFWAMQNNTPVRNPVSSHVNCVPSTFQPNRDPCTGWPAPAEWHRQPVLGSLLG